MWKVLVKLNPDMRSFDEVKKRKCNLFYQCKLIWYKTSCGSGCEAGTGRIILKDNAKEFKPL